MASGKKQMLYIRAESLSIWTDAKILIRTKTSMSLSEVLTQCLSEDVIPRLKD